MRKIIAVLMILFFAALCLPFDAKAQNEGRVAEIKEAIRGHREAIRQLKAELHALIGPTERGAASYEGEAEEQAGEKYQGGVPPKKLSPPPPRKPNVKPPLPKGSEGKKRWMREKAKRAEKPPLKGRGPGLAPAPGQGKGLEKARRETPGRGPGLKAAPGKGQGAPTEHKGNAGPHGGGPKR